MNVPLRLLVLGLVLAVPGFASADEYDANGNTVACNGYNQRTGEYVACPDNSGGSNGVSDAIDAAKRQYNAAVDQLNKVFEPSSGSDSGSGDGQQ